MKIMSFIDSEMTRPEQIASENTDKVTRLVCKVSKVATLYVSSKWILNANKKLVCK